MNCHTAIIEHIGSPYGSKRLYPKYCVFCSLRVVDTYCTLVVMHSSDRPRSCDQNIRLPVPPDLPDDSLPLLQSSRLLQLLSRREHVYAPQSAVGLTAACTHGPHGHFGDLRLLLIVVRDALILVFLTGLLQLSPLRGRGRPAVAAGPEGDGRHHEAQCHE